VVPTALLTFSHVAFLSALITQVDLIEDQQLS